MKKLGFYLLVFLLFLVDPVWAAEEAAGGSNFGPVGMGLAVLGAGIGIGAVGYSAVQGISRNPTAAGKLFLPYILGFVLVEGVAIIAIALMFIQ